MNQRQAASGGRPLSKRDTAEFPAFVHVAGGVQWTWSDLERRVRERLDCLRAQGLGPGQLVAVSERPGADLVVMLHALARAGAALLPIPAAGGDPAQVRREQALVAATGAEWRWVGTDRGGQGLQARRRGVPSGDPPDSPLGLVVETSGSSGEPRAAMLERSALACSARLVNERLGLDAGDTWLCCLPLRHIGALSIVYRCAMAGATLLLHEGFDAEAVAHDLDGFGVTHLSLVPPMLARLLNLERPPPSALRVLLVGGQQLSQPLARRALDAGWPLHVTYGMTETASQVATSGRLGDLPEVGVVGPTLSGVELDCPACAGPPGVLRVRGPLVMAGYANPDRVPGLGLDEGWFKTGDLACLEQGGVLRVLGRADEVLVTGGINVHPARVEAALLAAPGLTDLAVVGVEDPVWGQRLVALYVGEASAADLDAWCRTRLAGAQRPRAFVSLDRLPTLASGKRDRGRLRELALHGLAAATSR